MGAHGGALNNIMFGQPEHLNVIEFNLLPPIQNQAVGNSVGSNSLLRRFLNDSGASPYNIQSRKWQRSPKYRQVFLAASWSLGVAKHWTIPPSKLLNYPSTTMSGSTVRGSSYKKLNSTITYENNQEFYRSSAGFEIAIISVLSILAHLGAVEPP